MSTRPAPTHTSPLFGLFRCVFLNRRLSPPFPCVLRFRTSSPCSIPIRLLSRWTTPVSPPQADTNGQEIVEVRVPWRLGTCRRWRRRWRQRRRLAATAACGGGCGGCGDCGGCGGEGGSCDMQAGDEPEFGRPQKVREGRRDISVPGYFSWILSPPTGIRSIFVFAQQGFSLVQG